MRCLIYETCRSKRTKVYRSEKEKGLEKVRNFYFSLLVDAMKQVWQPSTGWNVKKSRQHRSLFTPSQPRITVKFRPNLKGEKAALLFRRLGLGSGENQMGKVLGRGAVNIESSIYELVASCTTDEFLFSTNFLKAGARPGPTTTRNRLTGTPMVGVANRKF